MLTKRRTTSTVMIDNIPMGSAHPIVIQSMTNTPTADTDKTIAQIKELADAGSELVRLTVNDFSLTLDGGTATLSGSVPSELIGYGGMYRNEDFGGKFRFLKLQSPVTNIQSLVTGVI